MIFITVGTQLPFDRLLNAVDDWLKDHPENRAFGQIGPSEFTSPRIETRDFIDAATYRKQMEEARVLVAHAGMGSILTALELGKKVIVMPRRASLGEHRNEHQLATADRLSHLGNLTVVQDETALAAALDTAMDASSETYGKTEASENYTRLIGTLRRFIAGEEI